MLTDDEIKSRFRSHDGVSTCILYGDETNCRIMRFILGEYMGGRTRIQAKQKYTKDTWERINDIPCNFVNYLFREEP